MAFAEAARDCAAASLSVFTDDSRELAKACEQLPSVADRISIVTKRDLSPRDYEAFDVLLHPSLSESLPRVVLEARSRGLIIVASDIGDTKSLMSDKDIAVIPGDHDALVDAIRTILAIKEPINWLQRQRTLGHSLTTSAYLDALLTIVAKVESRL